MPRDNFRAVVGTIPGIALPSARRAAFLRQAIERAVEVAEKATAAVKHSATAPVPPSRKAGER